MKNIMILIISFTLSLSSLLGQNDDAIKGVPSENKDEVTYRLNVIHKVNTFHTSTLTESTNVIRTYPDGSTKNYKRDIKYFLTTKIMESPSDGFQTIIVTVDSMLYKFAEGDVTFEFDSQDMLGKAPKFKDLNFRTVALGRSFNLTYSPYGDVAKIDGEEVQETLDYIKEKGEGYLADIDLYIWNEGLSAKHLEYLGDNKKVILPEERIAKDKIWKSPISLEFNGYRFSDTLDLKISQYNAGEYLIDGVSTSIDLADMKFLSYDIIDLINITDTKGEGSFKMLLKANGTVNSTEMNYRINSNLKVGNQNVKELIQSNISWELVQSYKL